jgi:hypothetical protein
LIVHWENGNAGLIVEMMGKETLARSFVPRQWDVAQDGTFVLMERKLRSGWDWIENHWILIKGAARKELNFSLRLYSATELGSVLRQGGFKAVEFFGSLAGAP